MTIANRTRVYLSIIFGQGEFMADEVMIILDLSQDVQTLLEQQGVNLFQELQREIPAIHTSRNRLIRTHLQAVEILLRSSLSRQVW